MPRHSGRGESLMAKTPRYTAADCLKAADSYEREKHKRVADICRQAARDAETLDAVVQFLDAAQGAVRGARVRADLVLELIAQLRKASE